MIFNQPEPKSVILGIQGFREETMPLFVPPQIERKPKVSTILKVCEGTDLGRQEYLPPQII
jgi:hypothetical protein